ncbi:MAG: hypothetical protein MUE30_13655 [Spirosomaceae bacterium]|jgi:hypothetical protein|nr:hypothetical protein [Spirosomataceae bacterium]
MKRQHNFRSRFLLFPLFAAVAALVMGAIVMFLWNATLPALVGVTTISFWQAVGLLLLCRILFGNFGRGSMGGNPRWKNHSGPPWREKWNSMTDDERAKLREEWRKRCGK